MFEISAFALAAVDHGSPETTRKPDKNVDAKQSLALEEAAMEKADKYAKLIKALEDAHSIADELERFPICLNRDSQGGHKGRV